MPFTARDVRRALLRAGFVEGGQKGSHLRLERLAAGDEPRRVILPMHRGDLPLGTLRAILRAAGLSEDDLRRLLRR
jgi:predicted RNA binding protein YcfA (HicA-like mRNA interferase family)